MTAAEAMALALQYRQAGDLGNAAHIYRQVRQTYPSNLEAKTKLAYVLLLQGDYGTAVSEYRVIVQLALKQANAERFFQPWRSMARRRTIAVSVG